ncbi:type II toxin-antitoxin system HicB family antitoxin [Burkholderia plantarii]|uniref:type II toxin-antitoxin system HicB family antitoxin n=1 Tax=Burkholderia plantarii TaxID=41899 RepID=UPI0008706687|nr:type II toxin-antitoxin system HicB family antitoxin [Burkholderia plantarii]
MEYPIYITRYITRRGISRYRGALPDFPAVEAEGGSYAELDASAIQQIVARHDGQARLVPPPTVDMSILQASGLDTGQGIWRFIEIDLGRVSSTILLVALSLPRQLVRDIDRMASELGITRDLTVSLLCEHGAGHPARGAGPDRLAPAALPEFPIM